VSTTLAPAAPRERPPIPCPSCGAHLPEEVAPAVWCGCGTEVRVARFRPTRRAASLPRPAAVEAGTPCAYHSGNAAAATCTRCGSFLCELCATPLETATYCTACFERLNAEGRLEALSNHLPRPHALALGAAFLALIPVFGLVFVPLSIWQGVKAVRRYDQLSERERAVWPYLALAGLFVAGSVAFTIFVFRVR
jgi:hypothetical protein